MSNKNGIRVLVCGGRDFTDYGQVELGLERIDSETPIAVIIEGGARGADRLAFTIAGRKGWGSETYEADWEKLGPKAGPIRNQMMLDAGRPDLVVAFPGGRGTADMLRRAEAAGVRVMKIDAKGESNGAA